MDNKLRIEFFGNEKFSCGALIKEIRLEEFLTRFNLKTVKNSEFGNEYGTTDITLENETFRLVVEINDDNLVTHVLVFEERCDL